MFQYKVAFDNLPWELSMKGLRYKAYRHNNKQLRLIEYTKEMPLHWCEKGHYGYILDGTFEIEYQNEKIIYQTGDGVFIPEGEKHKHRAKVVSDLVKVLFVEDV